MAVVLDSLVGRLTRTVFVKPPDTIREWTDMPRAIVNFNILNGVISAKPVNDQQELIVSMTLPTFGAYRFLDFTASLIQDVANDWNPIAYLEVTNAIRNLQSGMTQRHAIRINDALRIPVPLEMWITDSSSSQPASLPRYIFQRSQASQSAEPVVTFKATNQTAAAGAAGTLDFFASFMEFDIEQAERFPIHWPTMVYSR